MMESEQRQMVYCVVCVEPDGNTVTHIFSTEEKARAFADKDPRDHVLYDYIIDEPARMEEPHHC